MRWIKYTLIGLTGLLLVCGMLVITAVYLLNDDHYRKALIAAFEYQTGDNLSIEGAFSFDLSLRPRLSVSQITVESATDEYDVNIGLIQVQIELLPLLAHQLVVRKLAVQEFTLNLRPSSDERDSPWNLQLDKIAVPVIENTLFTDIRFNYWKPGDTSPVNFTLAQLKIDDINDAGPVILRGSGDLEGQEFTFTGELGDLDKLLQTDQPYPLELSLTTPNGEYSIGGIVSNPDEGSGLDLQFQGAVPDLHNVFKLLHVDTPELGRLDFSGQIKGELAQPALQNLELSVRRNDVLEFSTTGSVGNLLTKEDTALRFEGKTTDPELIKWLFPEMEDGTHLAMSGRLEAMDGMYWLREFKADTANPAGLKLNIAGESGLVIDRQPFRHLNAVLTFYTPNSAAARDLLFEQLPEVGPVKGRGTYVSPDDGDALAMKDIHIELGPKDGLSVTATGSIGHIPVGDTPIGDIAIHIDINSPTTKQIADELDMTLPELGPTRVRGLYTGAANKSAFRDMSIVAGSPATVLLKAKGYLDFGPLDADETIRDLSVELDASTSSTANLSSIIGHTFPDFGTMEARGTLTGSEKSLNLGKINITTRRKDEVLVNVRGSIFDLTAERQWDLTAEVSARNLKALGDPFGQPLPAEGIVKAFGHLKGTPQKIRFQGQIDLAKTSMTARITGTYGKKRPRFEGTLTIPEFNVGDFGLHPKMAGKTAAENQTQKNARDILFSRDRFHLALLNALDLDLDITVDEVTGTQALIDTVHARLNLEDSVLSISPVSFVFDEGKMQLDANLFGNSKPPRMTLSVKGDDLKIGTMLEQLQDHPIAHGFLTVVVDLETQGNSPADAAANLNGIASFAAENAKVRRTDLELLTTDFFGWAFSSTLSTQRYVNVDCAILRTKTDNGIMSIESLMMDTASINLKGGGTINLVDQTIDMAIYPKTKNKIWRATNPIKIHGPLADPDVDAISARAIAQNYGPLIIAPMLFLPAEALGHLVGLINERGEKTSPCLKYTEAEGK